MVVAERSMHCELLYQVGENGHRQRLPRTSAKALGSGNLSPLTAKARVNCVRGTGVFEGGRREI